MVLHTFTGRLLVGVLIYLCLFFSTPTSTFTQGKEILSAAVETGTTAAAASVAFCVAASLFPSIGLNVGTSEPGSTTKECILDTFATTLKDAFVEYLVFDIVTWAQGGFYGKPLVLSNPSRFFGNIGDTIESNLIADLGLGVLCDPLGINIAAIIQFQLGRLQSPGLPPERGCKISQAFENIEKFSVTFTEKPLDIGTDDFHEAILSTLAPSEIGATANEIAEAKQRAEEELQEKSDEGTLSRFEECPEYKALGEAIESGKSGTTVADGKGTFLEDIRVWVKCDVVQSGREISSSIDRALDGKFSQLVNADEFTEILHAVIRGVLVRVNDKIRRGGHELNEFFNSPSSGPSSFSISNLQDSIVNALGIDEDTIPFFRDSINVLFLAEDNKEVLESFSVQQFYDDCSVDQGDGYKGKPGEQPIPPLSVDQIASLARSLSTEELVTLSTLANIVDTLNTEELFTLSTLANIVDTLNEELNTHTERSQEIFSDRTIRKEDVDLTIREAEKLSREIRDTLTVEAQRLSALEISDIHRKRYINILKQIELIRKSLEKLESEIDTYLETLYVFESSSNRTVTLPRTDVGEEEIELQKAELQKTIRPVVDCVYITTEPARIERKRISGRDNEGRTEEISIPEKKILDDVVVRNGNTLSEDTKYILPNLQSMSQTSQEFISLNEFKVAQRADIEYITLLRRKALVHKRAKEYIFAVSQHQKENDPLNQLIYEGAISDGTFPVYIPLEEGSNPTMTISSATSEEVCTTSSESEDSNFIRIIEGVDFKGTPTDFIRSSKNPACTIDGINTAVQSFLPGNPRQTAKNIGLFFAGFDVSPVTFGDTEKNYNSIVKTLRTTYTKRYGGDTADVNETIGDLTEKTEEKKDAFVRNTDNIIELYSHSFTD